MFSGGTGRRWPTRLTTSRKKVVRRKVQQRMIPYMVPDEGMKVLVERMEVHVNTALAQELWYEASQMQQAIMIVLDASSGNPPTGMSMEVVQNPRGVFQRLYRYSRNHGGGVMIDIYRQYIDDMYRMMQPGPIRD